MSLYVSQLIQLTCSCICELTRNLMHRCVKTSCLLCRMYILLTLGYHKCLSPSGKPGIVYIAGYMGMLDNVAEINVSSESVVVWTFQANLWRRLSRLCSFIFYHVALKVNSLRIVCVHNLSRFRIFFYPLAT